MESLIECKNSRRFGVEVELNTFTGEVVKLNEENGENPVGADKVGVLINQTLNQAVSIQGWDHTNNNNCWIVKPDSSCGIEVCSPVLKGWGGLVDLMKVVRCFRDNELKADKRCSMHVHVNIADLDKNQLASVIAWYIKCEHVILDSVPSHRKQNRYCQVLGMTDLFEADTPLIPDMLFHKLSLYKYYTMNIFHFMKGGGFDKEADDYSKKTMEFRVAEHEACLDPYFVKNWVRFLIHFIDVTKHCSLPKPYKSGNQWTGLAWMNPVDVFRLLKFDQELSPGMTQVRNWFIKRVLKNGFNTGLPGVFSEEGRSINKEQFLKLATVYKTTEISTENEEDLLFSKKYKT